MDHDRRNIHRRRAAALPQVTAIGRGPSLAAIRRIATIMESLEQVFQVEHRFHFYTDIETSEVLVLWFCEGRLQQRRMKLNEFKELLSSLTKAGFQCTEVTVPRGVGDA